MPAEILLERAAPAFTLRLSRYGGGQTMAEHAHDQDGLSVVLEGTLVEDAQHRSVAALSGWSVVKPAGTYHANRFGPTGAMLLSVTFTSTMDDGARAAWQWQNGVAIYALAVRLLRDMRADRRLVWDDAVTELVAAASAERAPPSQLARAIKLCLDDPESDRTSVADMARAASVHPVYLARAFRAAYGMSIREYRQIVIVRRAMELVMGTRRPLSEIAHHCGFSDHSHMCRSFRRVANVSPAVLRGSRV
jgi:AraC family transcriptional regulator